MKKKIILSSVLVIVLCLCVIAGSTFALFTAETNVSIAVTAGKLDVTATIDQENVRYKSLNEEFKVASELTRTTHFANGGKAELTANTLQLSNITPGDAVAFDVAVVNGGEVAVAYTVKHDVKFVDADGNVVEVKDADGNPLPDMVTVTVTPKGSNTVMSGQNAYADLGGKNATAEFTIVVEFPNGTVKHDNQYQGLSVAINFTVEVVQANGVDNGNLILPSSN